MKIGVLALQGAFEEHITTLRRLGVDAVAVRLPQALDGLDGLIIPGGESTTIGKLAVRFGLMEPLREFAAQKAIWGTCAGMIFMACEITGVQQPMLGIMAIVVERNALGRQVDSFIADVPVPDCEDGESFAAVFIRAPKLVEVGASAETLITLPDGTAVAARQNRWLVTAFHPELTDDDRFHRYFLQMAAE